MPIMPRLKKNSPEPKDNKNWGKVPEEELEERNLELELENMTNRAEELADEVQRQNDFIKRSNAQLFDLMKFTITKLVNGNDTYDY